MADQQSPQASGLQVPPDVAAKFGSLIALIKQSESMNDEERQYWISILPIMTPEQVKNLQEILENERNQLQAIDAKYAKEMGKLESKEALRAEEDNRRKKRETRATAEQAHKEQEEQSAEDILKKIEGAA